jgi:hypothetical protein
MASVDELRMRPWNYVYDSGVPWLMAGLVSLINGSAGLITHRLPLHYQTIPSLVAIVCMLLVYLAARQVNLRIVTPRGGYVEPDDRFDPRNLIWIPITLAGEAAIIWLLRFVTGFDTAQVLWPGFAICLAFIIAGVGRQITRPRMYWFALYLLAMSAVLLWARVGAEMTWFTIGIGVPLTVLGAMRLRKFLEENPAE